MAEAKKKVETSTPSVVTGASEIIIKDVNASGLLPGILFDQKPTAIA